MFFSNMLHLAGVCISRRVRSVPWRTCVARRDPAHMPAHPRGCGTRAVCLTPGYQARQTYGLPPTIPPPEAAEPPRLTNLLSGGGPSRPRQGSKLGSRGCQSPGRVVRWVMVAARMSPCDETYNAPPRNAMACDVANWICFSGCVWCK
jgi:hypothetical protein